MEYKPCCPTCESKLDEVPELTKDGKYICPNPYCSIVFEKPDYVRDSMEVYEDDNEMSSEYWDYEQMRREVAD